MAPLCNYYEAVAVNVSSFAVGRYRTTTGAEHAVTWNANRSIVPWGTPASFIGTNAFDINDDDIIVGANTRTCQFYNRPLIETLSRFSAFLRLHPPESR
jgi:hypothetical protein